ncbi:MAG: hypothetical protein E6G53_15555 [Actinobacteria bacterium]|nr:MAG: hypothetical protein E6G53_15555 [Actinomycetota bacterium]
MRRWCTAVVSAGLAATLVAGCGGGGFEKKADVACAKAADARAAALEARPTIYGKANPSLAAASVAAVKQELDRLSALKPPSAKRGVFEQYLKNRRDALAAERRGAAIERQLTNPKAVAKLKTATASVGSQRVLLRQLGFALGSKLGLKDCAGRGGSTRDSDQMKQVNRILQTTNSRSNCSKYMTRAYVILEYDNLASCMKQISSPQGLGKPPAYPQRAQIVGSTGILFADYRPGTGAPGTPPGRWTFYFYKQGGKWKVQGQRLPAQGPAG